MRGEIINLSYGGFVQLVDYMGSDETIANSARVSYGGKKKRSDEDLIKYLLRNEHMSPFEMVEFMFIIKVPIFVARQMFRHRTASFNEISGRYTQYEEEFFVPNEYRIDSQTNKQESELIENENYLEEVKVLVDDINKKSFEVYNKLLHEKKLTKELSRTVLPLGTFTKYYYKQDLRNLMNFLRLRLDNHAQKEIREVANAIEYFVKNITPITYSAFKSYIMESMRISREDLHCLPKEERIKILEAFKNMIQYQTSKTRKKELERMLEVLFA
jgi:thymidylate synthase (FAD)